ncbi:hypothetical protein ECDEC7C_3106 [Escherichia coli DEC7C]|nr:hypothetical protein ECDEC7C_3106 [Escherichia coli DEC7C]
MRLFNQFHNCSLFKKTPPLSGSSLLKYSSSTYSQYESKLNPGW